MVAALQCCVSLFLQRSILRSVWEVLNLLIQLFKSSSKTFRLVVDYRPPPSKKNGSTSELFFEEFGSILEELATEKGQIMEVGDFNFHIDDHNNTCAGRFMDLLQTFDYAQHVEQPTQRKPHSRFDHHQIRR